MDCRVVLEAAVSVYDVSTPEEAIRIAIAKTGQQLNPDLSHVEIETGDRTTPGGEPLDPVFVVADEALVALELAMTVFSVERPEHAERIARKEIGQRLENVPLAVLSVEAVTEQPDESAEMAGESGVPIDAEDGEAPDAGVDGPVGDEEPVADSDVTDDGDEPAEEADDDVLPEFEELL